MGALCGWTIAMLALSVRPDDIDDDAARNQYSVGDASLEMAFKRIKENFHI